MKYPHVCISASLPDAVVVIQTVVNLVHKIHNMADAGEVLGGPIGREIGGAAQTIFLIFTMGSHVLTFTIAMNAITGHATCQSGRASERRAWADRCPGSIVWAVVGTAILWLLSLPRTLKNVSYLSIACKPSLPESPRPPTYPLSLHIHHQRCLCHYDWRKRIS